MDSEDQWLSSKVLPLLNHVFETQDVETFALKALCSKGAGGGSWDPLDFTPH